MHDRHGAKQPERFDPARAARLDDPKRFEYVSVEEILALLDPPQGTRLVDFGTGTGTYAIAIAKCRPDLHVIAFDEQAEMLALLQAKLKKQPLHNVSAVLAGGEPVVGERLLALNVLHEVGDAPLAEIKRMVLPGGRALFIDWNGDVERPVGPPRDHVYTLDEARARLRGAGFAIVE
ncbi:MAG TPA: methyltransferase domain-containing protein, partial [Candidatus Aquilonibacter sp.]|nr:methyltransferase domain-containing protein [Candidatus Aquilonibacter sp.]